MVLYTVKVEKLLFQHQVKQRKISQGLQALINQGFAWWRLEYCDAK